MGFLVATILLMRGLDVWFAKQGWFIEHKIAKAEHMAAYVEQTGNDVIFIGHSRIQNHISTAYFKQRGVDIYTYGIPSLTLSDFPYMVERALETHPKAIVLNLSVKHLYNGATLPKMVQPTFWDVYEQFRAVGEMAEAKNMYDFFPIRSYFDKYAAQILQSGNDVRRKVERLTQRYGSTPDCNVFAYRGKKRIVTLCTNGNGTVWSNKVLRKRKKNVLLKRFSDKRIELLNALVGKIESQGVRVFVLLESVSQKQHFIFEKPGLYSRLEIAPEYIIDSTDIVFKKAEFADGGHVNVKGKQKMNRFVYERMFGHKSE